MNFIIIPDGYITPQHGNFSTNFYITGGSKQKTQDQRAFLKHFWPQNLGKNHIWPRLVGLFSLHIFLRFCVHSIKSLFCTDLPLTDPYTAKKEKIF